MISRQNSRMLSVNVGQENMICPQDSEPLQKETISDCSVYRCTLCQGIWLPGGLVDRVVEQSNFGSRLKGKIVTESNLICPTDKCSLGRINYKNIEIDLCTICDGIWFDKNELNTRHKQMTGTDLGADMTGKNAEGLIKMIFGIIVEVVLSF
jgi:Zn-finger nucleic acid-binding protein